MGHLEMFRTVCGERQKMLHHEIETVVYNVVKYEYGKT